VQHLSITNSSQLSSLCDHLAKSEVIAFDTEFVSEDSYRPQLCLVQVAAEECLAVIDPIALPDLDPFWNQLADGNHETVVHAGREELNFCLLATEKRPARLFDTQIAAALVSSEYPAGYGSLIFKFLGHRPAKGETRTDWRRRPLSPPQIQYALEDVRHLLELHSRIREKLVDMNRLGWLDAEMTRWQQEVEAARTRPRWRRVSGISGLSSRSLAIVRELWNWREEQAAARDTPPRRVLRDDLIVEIAKRKLADESRILAVRGMQRGALRRAASELARCVQRALDLSDEECPQKLNRDLPPQLNVLAQFLSPALNSICRSAQVATSIVGTAADVRELVACHLGFASRDAEPPALAVGWRAELVGNLIDDLLDGKKSIRISDPSSDHPLVFESVRSVGNASRKRNQ